MTISPGHLRLTNARPAAPDRQPARATRAVVVVVALVLGMSAATARAQSAMDYPPYAVSAGGRYGHGFAIRNPDGKPNCVVVTSSHVARPGDEVRLVGRSASAQTPVRIEVAARYFEAYPQAELAVLLPAQDLPACRSMQLGDVDAAARRDSLVGRTPFVSPATGEPSWARLVLESSSKDSCRFYVGSIGSVLVEPGFSGGLVSFDDQPLGVVQRAERNSAAVSRFECAPAFLKRYVLPDDASRARRPAWDVSGLPEEYRKVFNDAQKQMRRAELAQRVAREFGRLAEEAEIRANANIGGHAWVRDSTGTYRGQVDAQGRTNGMGVRRVASGDVQGDVLLGQWQVEPDGKLSSLFGPGVWRREANAGSESNEHALYEGEFSLGNYHGNGVVTFRSGDTVFSEWRAGNNNAPMIYKRAADGFWFTGTAVNGRWSGPGILWDKDGQIRYVGSWKNGNFVDDRTRALLPP